MTETAFQRDAFQFQAFAIEVNPVAAVPARLSTNLSTKAIAHATRAISVSVHGQSLLDAEAFRLRSAKASLAAGLHVSSGWGYPAEAAVVRIATPAVTAHVKFPEATASLSFPSVQSFIRQSRLTATIKVPSAEVQID